MNENQALYGGFNGSNEVASSAICHAFPKGNFYSQRGNILFPGWECFVPNVGIIFTLNGLSFYSFLSESSSNGRGITGSVLLIIFLR